MDGIKYVCMDCWEEFDEAHEKCPECGDEMSPDAKVPPGALYATYQIRTTCGRCGQPMPLNGPLQEVVCGACNNKSEFPPERWQSLLEDFVEERKDFGWADSRSSTMMTGGGTFELTYGRQMPHCPECHKVLPAFDIPIGANEELTCRKCEAKVSTFPAPDWLREVLPTARQIYGAEREPDAAPAGAVEAEGGEATRPVVMQCPQCGSALRITAESERLVPCEYCDVDVYLPEDVWRRLHPVKTSDRWMIRFEVPVGQASGEAEEADDVSLFDADSDEDSDSEMEATPSPVSTNTAKSGSAWWLYVLLLLGALGAAIFVVIVNSME